MSHRIAVAIAAISLLVFAAPTALAARNIVHYQFDESEQSSMPLDDELAACVGYSGIGHEDRTYDVRITEFVDGPRAGRVHLTGFVFGDFTIDPDDPNAGPVYEGSYREKITFIGTSFDDPLVFSFSLPVTASSTDGSQVKFLMHGHGVIGPDNEPRNLVFKFNCIQGGA
jgi:hypothetical protein